MPLQATSGAASYDAFGGGVPVVPQYIEDVFSTQVYTGTGATNNIVNGIDLAGKGGLVWTKARSTTSAFTFAHALMDTLRGAGIQICSDRTDANTTQANSLTSFNSDGYTLGADTGQGRVNNSSYGTQTYVGWTFRKQPKFFDVVTYTGTGSATTITHNLGSVPACIIIKDTANGSNWQVYHQSLGATQYVVLNSTLAAASASNRWNNTAPTSSVFTIGDSSTVNTLDATYVAYLFAHDAGGFGLTGTDNVISCGSFTYSGATTVTLGYEPQWILYKDSTNADNWNMFDNMRGLSMTNDKALRANTSGAEIDFDYIDPTSTGFTLKDGTNGATYIYIAIRRGPMKVPTSGTSVFAPIAYTGNGTGQSITTGITGDLTYIKYRTDGGAGNFFFDRLRNPKAYLDSSSTAAEVTATQHITAFNQLGFSVGNNGNVNDSGGTFISQTFKRAPSFFDEVCYTGDSNARNITHNLTVAPELIIIKRRSNSNSWFVWHSAFTTGNNLELNSTGAPPYANGNMSPLPSSSVFSIGGTYPDNGAINLIGQTYVAYLFATCAGVSKCFSYTGNGSSQTINCGFTGGARFVLIKRTDSTGDWYVWDTARGIVSGNDPHLSLNTTAAEVTTDDSVDTDSTGFIVNQLSATNVNVSSATYIGIAIA